MTDPDSHSPAPILGNRDIVELITWRHELHRYPDLSGAEADTADRVAGMLAATTPDQILTGLGGHGVAAVYEGAAAGPTILIRSELDALPIEELGEVPYRSERPRKAHLCGHDGHMAILAGVARWLGRNRPRRGRAILLFQPAEEDGAGAARVIADSRYADLAPNFSLALHNMPGLPIGSAVVRSGMMNCASRGMKIVLTGRTAHASQPETGISPVPALTHLAGALTALGKGGSQVDADFSLVTVTHLQAGEPAFGIAPGQGVLWATLRTQRDDTMASLVNRAEAVVREAASAAGLGCEISYHDVFRHCENAPEAVAMLAEALAAEGVPLTETELPMRASEDFGRFGDHAKSAMMLLGSGTDSPALHNPDYDFPDELIDIGARVFIRCLRTHLF